jgi:hypothetical protein
MALFIPASFAWEPVMPVVFRDGPYRFSFFAGDRNEPPHVHVLREDLAAEYWLEPQVRLARNGGFRPHELNRIERIARENREQLLEMWHEFFNR